MDLTQLTISQAINGLNNKEFTAVELTKCILNKHDQWNAFITKTPDKAISTAQKADQRIQQGVARPLEGIPLAIKDLFCTNGILTTAGSRILYNFVPPYESTVTQKLWDAGATLIGKTSLDEFAMGSSNLTSHYGPVINPWSNLDEPRVPGGSSGGSAAAVSSYLCLGATGTDTGGSIRQPASFCGVVGLKPTYGRCSRYGVIAFASSLDQAGPMTRSVRDSAIMLQYMAGYDPKDSTSANIPVPNFEDALTGNVKGLRVGVPSEYHIDGLPDEIIKLWHNGISWLKDAGCIIKTISLPHTSYALPAYYIISPAEASSNLARYDGMRFGLRIEGKDLSDTYQRTRAAGFGDEVKRRILIGTYVLSQGYYDAYYTKAQQVRALVTQDFTEAFNSVDAILTPTAPSEAFLASEKMDPVSMYMNDVFTIPASLAGLPAISVPSGLSKNSLPFGLQIIGRPFDEETILRIAEVVERAAEFDKL